MHILFLLRQSPQERLRRFVLFFLILLLVASLRNQYIGKNDGSFWTNSESLPLQAK